MFRRKGFYIAIAMTVVAVVSLVAFAAPRHFTDDQMVAQRTSVRSGSLDEAFNQLRYIRTTDFGATWTTAQAGDLSTFSPYDNEPFGDFSAVTMSNGDLCYLIALANAATPGVYALAGPTFAPVLVMANGNNDLFSHGYTNGGHTDISRAPDGSLVGIIWGQSSTGSNTVWACKSTDNGGTWNSWVIATEPAIPPNEADFGWFKLPDRCSNQWDWVIYQDPSDNGWDMHVIRFDHTTTNAGTNVMVDYSGHQFSFMFGGLKPIAYDPANNWLYLVFRNHDLSGVLIYSSNDLGATFQQAADVPAPLQRYPSVALRAATQTPWMVYGETVGSLQPGEQQCTYDSYDEGGYGAGLWTDVAQLQCVTLSDPNTAGFNSVYFPQMWWWDATHGYAQYDGYTNFLLGEIIETSRTTDGGATWVDMGTRVHYITNQLIAGTMQPSEIVGGENGLGYIIFSGAPGVTDEESPTVSNPEVLTSPIGLGPYVVRAFYWDNVGIKVDDPDNRGPWVNWNVGDAPDPVNVATATPDSSQTDAQNRGWFYYTIPGPFSPGDHIWIYCDGYDVSGLYGDSYETNNNYPYIIAGDAYFGADDPAPNMPTAFALHPNYPNPFNPETQISFDLAAPAQVTLTVFNTLGQEVARLADHRAMNAGSYSLTFSGANLTSGVYLYRIDAGNFVQTRKMVLVK